MKVAIASDHAGYLMKNELVDHIRALGHEPLDLGTDSTEPVDYPDFAEAVSLAISGGEAQRGILICGSGVGVSVAANKIPGIRAGLCHDIYSAHQGVEHDDMNVLVMGARVIGSELAKELTEAFLNAVFTARGRHLTRLEKLRDLERRYCGN